VVVERGRRDPRYTGRQVRNKQRKDEVLIDVEDVAHPGRAPFLSSSAAVSAVAGCRGAGTTATALPVHVPQPVRRQEQDRSPAIGVPARGAVASPVACSWTAASGPVQVPDQRSGQQVLCSLRRSFPGVVTVSRPEPDLNPHGPDLRKPVTSDSN
jgi:hypothetical protein